MSPTARLYAAALLVSTWLGLLLFGLALHGAVHFVLAAALAIAPWRAQPSPPAAGALNGEDGARAPRAPDGEGGRS